MQPEVSLGYVGYWPTAATGDYMLPSNAVNPASMMPDLAKSYQTGADKALAYIQLSLQDGPLLQI